MEIFSINQDTKTVSLINPVKLKDLIKVMKQFPKWKKYTLEANSVEINVIPHMYTEEGSLGPRWIPIPITTNTCCNQELPCK